MDPIEQSLDRVWNDAEKRKELLYLLGQKALTYSDLAWPEEIGEDFEEIIQEFMRDGSH